jgi:hypothetical protein
MELLNAIAGMVLAHPLWVACLAALCGLGIAWRWHQEKRSLRRRALSIMAASAPPARSSVARYLLVSILSVATTLLVGQVSWGIGVTRPPSQQNTVSKQMATAPSSPSENDARGLDLDALLRHGAIIEIRVPSACVTEATQPPTPTATWQLIEATTPCPASAQPHNKGMNESAACSP